MIRTLHALLLRFRFRLGGQHQLLSSQRNQPHVDRAPVRIYFTFCVVYISGKVRRSLREPIPGKSEVPPPAY